MIWFVRRRTAIRYAAVAASFTAFSCASHDSALAPASASVARSGPPNIVFLLADDMRYDVMGAAGNSIIKTPQLDLLARQGVLFRNAYVTAPICNISRASMFTGQYATRHGIFDFTTDFTPDQLAATYPVLLRAAGYRTGFVGKFGVGNNMPVQAFDFWRGFAGQGTYETVDSTGQPIHLTKLMTEQAISFLRSQPAGQPFMLQVSFKSPHPQDEDARQFIPDPADMGMYVSDSMPVPATAGDEYWNSFPDFFKANNLGRARWGLMFATPTMYQTSVKNYYRLVSGMDRAVGEIRNELRQLGRDSNTVIIFASDNGFLLGEHGLSHKWFGFEESVRVPLIVYDPRDRTGHNGRVESSIALNIDLGPTFLDLAGLPPATSMQGRSLTPLLRGSVPSDWRRDFLFEELDPDPTIRRSVGVVGGRYKYLKYIDPVPNYEVLYDLLADPLETTNFAQDPSYQNILDSLRAQYQVLLARAK